MKNLVQNNSINTEFDMMSISELEEELGKCKVPEFLLKTFCIGFSIVFVIALTGVFNMKRISTEAKDIKTGNEKEIYPQDSSTLITFNVKTFLGMKKITSDRKKDYYLVFGNYEKGFYIYDLNNNKIIYNYNGKPKEGVMVEVAKGNNIVMQPRY